MVWYILPREAPLARSALGWDGTDFRVLTVDATGHIQIDVLSSALPAGAATAAHQVTQITALQLIDDLRGALDSVGTDELDVNVEASVLPAGAATAAHQVTQNTALQLIDDLRNALQSVNTDALQVRGEDQLISYNELYRDRGFDNAAVLGTNTKDFGAVPAGEIWIITSVYAIDATSAITSINAVVRSGAVNYNFARIEAPGANVGLKWTGRIFLEEDDFVRFIFGGCVAGDDITWVVHGWKMSKE